MPRIQFGTVPLAPHHPSGENPTLLFQRDVESLPTADRLGFDVVAATGDRVRPQEPNGPSAGLVSIRPSTGEVVVMYGGDNFRQSERTWPYRESVRRARPSSPSCWRPH